VTKTLDIQYKTKPIIANVLLLNRAEKLEQFSNTSGGPTQLNMLSITILVRLKNNTTTKLSSASSVDMQPLLGLKQELKE